MEVVDGYQSLWTAAHRRRMSWAYLVLGEFVGSVKFVMTCCQRISSRFRSIGGLTKRKNSLDEQWNIGQAFQDVPCVFPPERGPRTYTIVAVVDIGGIL